MLVPLNFFYINEYELVSYRYFITLLTTAPLLAYLKIGYKIDLKNLALAVIVGIILAVYTALFFIGTSIGDISFGGAIITTFMPIIAFVIMMLFNKKKPNKSDWKVLFIGLLGVMIMMEFWHFDLEKIFTTATIFFLSAAFVWALMFVMTSKTKNIHPIIFSFYAYITCLLFNSLIFYQDINIDALFSMDLFFWFNIIFISVASTTFATTMYFFGVQRLGNNSIIFTFLVPFFTIILGIIIFQEQLKISTLIGVIIITIALIIMKNIKINNFLKLNK